MPAGLDGNYVTPAIPLLAGLSRGPAFQPNASQRAGFTVRALFLHRRSAPWLYAACRPVHALNPTGGNPTPAGAGRSGTGSSYPLTHFLRVARSIPLEGNGFRQIPPQVPADHALYRRSDDNRRKALPADTRLMLPLTELEPRYSYPNRCNKIWFDSLYKWKPSNHIIYRFSLWPFPHVYLFLKKDQPTWVRSCSS